MARKTNRKHALATKERPRRLKQCKTGAKGSDNMDMQWQVELGAREQSLNQREVALAQREQELRARQEEDGQRQEDLGEREAACDERARQLDERESELAAREQRARECETEAATGREVAAAQKEAEEGRAKAQELCRELEAKARSLQERERRLAGAEAELEQREEELRSREIEAENGFAAKRREARTALDREREELVQRNRQLEADLTQARIDRSAQLEKEVAAEAEKRREALGEEIQQRRESMDSELAEQREALARERERQYAELSAGAERLATERQEFDRERDEAQSALVKREREVARREREVTAELAMLEEDGQHLDRLVQQTAELEIRALTQRLEQTEQDRERLLQDCESLEGKLSQLREASTRFGHLSLEEAMQQQRELKAEIGRLEGELALRPPPETKERLELALKEQKEWTAQRQQMAVELDRLKTAEAKRLLSVSELESMRSLKEVAERQRDALLAAKDELAAEIGRLQDLHKTLYERPAEVEKRIGAIEKPIREFAERARAEVDLDLTEMAWLAMIHDQCGASGIRFKRRLLYAFHTALKTAEWSPLTVLAGVSGTGKSELPRLYSRFGGVLFVHLAVQPDWDGQHSLFGFFNSVDNQFNATSLLRAMVQSQKRPDDPDYVGGFADRLLLVLLDEMNLAHVELYFSELLSRLELRRGANKPTSIEIDMGAGLKPHMLPLGRNVLWAGTMNDDETTKTLSPKVLDRGNLIGFPRPVQLHRRRKLSLEPESPLLPLQTWQSWQKLGSDFTDDEIRPFKEALEQVSSCLEKAGRALGHRVWQATEHYLANHPQVAAARKSGDAKKQDTAMRIAFEDQLAQKVMPRMRGIENSGSAARECLDPIAELIATVAPGLVEDFGMARKTSSGAFLWQSANYLEASE